MSPNVRHINTKSKGGSQMLEKVDELRAAVSKVSEGRLTIWNSRLELAMRVGDANKIDQLLKHSPVADGGGCDCQCGGAAFRPEQVVLPEANR